MRVVYSPQAPLLSCVPERVEDMVGATVTASTGVMNSLLPKLTALLGEEYGKLKSVRRGIGYLRDELSSMNALTTKLADVEELDVQLKEWRNNVRELAYDIEDCVDTFMRHLGSGNAKASLIRRTTRKIKKLWVRHQVANQIQELKSRVMEVSDRRLRYKFEEQSKITESAVIDPRLPVLLAESKGLVGIDSPRERIAKWLLDEEQQLKVVSIVGCGGLGKTTLAMEVYRAVGGQFQCKASASVSRKLDLRKLTSDLLFQLDPGEHGRLEMLEVEQLSLKLREHLKDKRYLIIIDDVWSISAWGLVKSVLPENKHQSRIITTTRITGVAESCCFDFNNLIYKIEPLDKIDSRRLFLTRIFHSDHSCPPQLEEVTNAILRKCGGLPLAIISIASLLASKPKIKDQWEIVQNSISSALEEASTVMNKILLFSYYDLPLHLKTCLLYLSIFPEDYKIKRETLIWKWIAEGFIVGGRGQNLEEVGDIYFNELINRSMIQPVDIQYDGRARACRVHDLVLDILISLSAEENFVTVLDGHEPKFMPNKIRRLSIQYSEPEDKVLQVSKKSLDHVRSINIFGCWLEMLDQLDFQAMRVLDFVRRCPCAQVKNIGNCFQLRYLDLSHTDITSIPEEIGKLENLETLDLTSYSIEGKLPSTVGQLRKLVRLFVCPKLILPVEITNIEALQVLWTTSCNSTKFLEGLGQMTQLRRLGIKYSKPDGWDGDVGRYNKIFCSSLRELGKHNLQFLEIQCHHDDILDTLMDSGDALPLLQKLGITMSICRLPKWVGSLVYLSYLQVLVETMEKNDLSILGNLPSLLYLELWRCHPPVERLVVENQGFQCLKEFFFRVLSGGMGLVFAPGAMPEVETLRLEFFAKGKRYNHGVGADFGLEHVSALKRVVIEIQCWNATNADVKSFDNAICNAVSTHPNRPAVEIVSSFMNCMAEESEELEDNGVQEETDEH